MVITLLGTLTWMTESECINYIVLSIAQIFDKMPFRPIPAKIGIKIMTVIALEDVLPIVSSILSSA